MTRKVMDDLRVVTSGINFMVGRVGKEKVYCDSALNETYKATDRSQYNHHPENGARGRAIMEAHNIAVDIFKANGVWHQKGFGTSLNLAVQKNVIVKNSCLHQALAILNDTVNMGPRHDPSHSQS